MPRQAPERTGQLPPAARRRALVVAQLNAGLWGAGSGLASTTLIVFLARHHGASGLAVSWILAAPSLVGLLRLATPLWLDRVASRRVFAVVMFLASAAALASLAILSAAGALGASRTSAAAIGAVWAGYHLLESMAAIALWSWLRDLAPPRVRGRFLGRREAWLNGGIVLGAVAAIAVTEFWRTMAGPGAHDVERQAYLACLLAGAGLLAAAALVLWRMPEAPRESGRRGATPIRLRDLAAPFRDARYRRFLAFGLWFSFSNGVIQTAQTLYVIGPLGISFGVKKSLDGVSRAVKATVLPVIGAAVDRRGNVPILAASQAAIAVAPLFFLYATPDAPWWILGAYACWLAYGGHDVALPNLMWGHSPPDQTATFAAAWFAWTQLAFSLSVVAGGLLLDWLAANVEPLSLGGGRPIDYYFLLFTASWALKSFGVALAGRVPEPLPADERPAARP
jgi:MFS family permease